MKPKETKISRENLSWLLESPMEIKMTLLNNHSTICQFIINQILEENFNELAGMRYNRSKSHQIRYSRWGYNDEIVRIGDEKVGVKVQRVID